MLNVLGSKSSPGSFDVTMALPYAVQRALGAGSEELLREVAVPWAATEEFFGHGDPVELDECLVELSTMVA